MPKSSHNSRTEGRRILGVASSGGHLVQLETLFRLGLSLDAIASPSELTVETRWLKVVDCNVNQPWRVVRCAASMFVLLWRLRPDVIITTGAAPGGIALVLGRLLGSRTVWIDSIANVERASLTGRLVKPFTHVWISQWQRVAESNGGTYIGKIFRFFDGGDTTSI